MRVLNKAGDKEKDQRFCSSHRMSFIFCRATGSYNKRIKLKMRIKGSFETAAAFIIVVQFPGNLRLLRLLVPLTENSSSSARSCRSYSVFLVEPGK